MKILIDIPKEFEQHFHADRFEDSLHRLSADAHLIAGNYEQETALMLIEALKKAVLVPPHGRLIDADALIDYCKHFAEVFKSSSLPTDKARRDELLGVIGEIINAPAIIPAEEGE